MKRPPFHVRILQQIAKPPTNEALIASDLHVTVPSVRSMVDVFVRYGRVRRVEVEGYPPHLCLTKAGREYLAEQKPEWWKSRTS